MEMRVAVCGYTEQETFSLCGWIQECCAACGRRVELWPMKNLEQFWGCFAPGVFYGVFLGLGDVAGFLAARRVREEDADCRIVLIDGTRRYALHSYRIHVTDFLLQPLTRERVGVSVERLLGYRE